MKVQEVERPQATLRSDRQPFRALLDEAKGAGPDPRTQAMPLLTNRPAVRLVPRRPTPDERPTAPAGSRTLVPRRPTPEERPTAPAGSRTLARAASQASVHAQVEATTSARGRVEGEAQRLLSVRAQHEAGATTREIVRGEAIESFEERVTARVVDQLVRELLQEFDGGPSTHPHSSALTMNMTPAPVPGATTSTGRAGEVRAEQAAALIEKIELFVRSQRPALALTLNNSLGARVEIERVGPSQVALKLVGRDGPPSADAVSRIREELRSRGLRVAALSVS